MKKQDSHHANERRKKTNAEVSADRRKRDIQQKQQINNSKPKWDDLNNVLAGCRQLLGSVRPVAGILANKELMEKMGDEVVKLRDMAAILNRDVTEYVSALNSIAQNHEGKTGVIENDSDLIHMFTIGEKYEQWSTSFESVVVSGIQDIFSIVNKYLPENERVG